MKKENILVIAIICIAAVGGYMYKASRPGNQAKVVQDENISQTRDATQINWQAYATGMELAKAVNKPIFLYFHADWCTYCKKLKQTTFKDKAVLRYLSDNFVSIRVDTDKNQTLANQWRVKGLPTLWFLKPDNSKISSLPGYVEAKQFLPILKYIHTESYDKMSFQEFIKTL